MQRKDLMRFSEQADFMDLEVEKWLALAREDPEVEVPNTVMKYYFHRSADLSAPDLPKRRLKESIDWVPYRRLSSRGRTTPEYFESQGTRQ